MTHPPGAADRDAILPILGVLATAVAWPFFVWIGELPRQRSYHRNLPVNHVTHDLLKVLAGACWLMLGVAVVLAAQLIMLLGTGFGSLVWGISPMALLNFFTGSLLIYLFVSVIPILSNKPIEWMLGLTLGVGAIIMPIARAPGTREWPLIAMEILLRSDLGLFNALAGAYMNQPWANLLEGGLTRSAVPHSTGLWLIATVLWTAVGWSLVYLASRFANRRSVS
jgi:hypothetical protein